MAETKDGFITLLNGEAAALPPYRRVKIDGSNPTKVVYADASDGDSWIGTTEPMEGGDVAVGAPVTIRLRGEHRSLKCEGSAAVVNGASIYPENDGKISDDAGSVVIGTALGAISTSGGIAEFLPNAGSGSAPDEEAIANADGTTNAGVPIALEKRGVTASGDTAVPFPARKLRIRKAFAVLRNQTTAVTVKLKIGATDISLTSALATADTFSMMNVKDDVTEVTSGGTIYLNLSATATAPGVDVFIDAIPIA